MMKTTKKTLLISGILALVVITLVFSLPECTNNSDAGLTIETFETETGGWGYNIINGKKLVIKQDVIPAVENNIPFQTENDAKKTARLVIKKLKHNDIPTITIEELNKLNVITKTKGYKVKKL